MGANIYDITSTYILVDITDLNCGADLMCRSMCWLKNGQQKFDTKRQV
jgi:hypothetical protein